MQPASQCFGRLIPSQRPPSPALPPSLSTTTNPRLLKPLQHIPHFLLVRIRLLIILLITIVPHILPPIPSLRRLHHRHLHLLILILCMLMCVSPARPMIPSLWQRQRKPVQLAVPRHLHARLEPRARRAGAWSGPGGKDRARGERRLAPSLDARDRLCKEILFWRARAGDAAASVVLSCVGDAGKWPSRRRAGRRDIVVREYVLVRAGKAGPRGGARGGHDERC
ncbi:hypothetical protein LshimejAT787_1202640 [Lyophyllum shimeji]|uniref:Uncharacterized protein n=1 Tax=Lyophyllum shimeji TaxID=47721 RepID=A0A9P3PVJ5_LYOSH|nr:hypothetical protein LshimejAT787_1202640 [Lyophyllum shimeji]